MKIQYIAFSLLSLLLVGCGPKPEPDMYKAPIVSKKEATKLLSEVSAEDIDGMYVLTTSTMKWVGSKVVGGAKDGTVAITSGAFGIEGGKLSSGSFTIDMTTIKDSGGNEGLEGHLKSEDFFGVENYPTATVVLTGAEETDTGANVTADLTIKGITNSISFPVSVLVKESGDLKATANFEIDRTLWDIKYGSGKFFTDLGDKVIKDEMAFDLELNFEKGKLIDKDDDEEKDDDAE